MAKHARPNPYAAAQPEARTASQPAVQPASQRATRSAQQPAAQPAQQPTLQPAPLPPQNAYAPRGAQAPPSTNTVQGTAAPYPSLVSRNIGIIFVAVALVLLVLLAVFVARSCQADEEVEPIPETESAYQSPFEWGNFERGDLRWSYVVDGVVRSRLGVDVSENQHEIDWEAVANDGIDFAMIRLGYRGSTEGDLYLDSYFYDNYTGAHEAGLDVGLYFFSQAVTVDEAIEEADYVLDMLDGAALEYPIAFDSEETVLGSAGRTVGLTNDEMTAIANAFCRRIEERGYKSMVYGNAYDLRRYNRAFKQLSRIWWAEYGSPVPLHNVDIVMWQYSNAGEVDGIPTYVDMNMDLSDCF